MLYGPVMTRPSAFAALLASGICLCDCVVIDFPPPEEPFPTCSDTGVLSDAPSDGLPVVVPAKEPPPISGGTLTVLADGSFVAADSDRDVVWLISGDGGVIRSVPLKVSDEPGRVVEGPPGTAFVALRQGGAVAQLDLTRAEVSARHEVCGAPRGLAWLESESTLAVACQTGTLAKLRFDLSGARPSLVGVEKLYPADDLRDVVAIGSTLYVSTFREARVYSVDPAGTVREVRTPRQKDGFTAGVAWRLIADKSDLVMLHQWASTEPIVAAPCGAPGGGDSPYGQGGVDPNAFAKSEARVHGGLTRITFGRTHPRSMSAGFIFQPVDVAINARGDWLTAEPVGSFASDAPPFGTTSSASFSAVGTPPVGQPTAVAARGNELAVFTREPARLTIYTPYRPCIGPGCLDLDAWSPQQIDLPGASVRSVGHDRFYGVTPSGLSCASCHPEAGDDGHVWNLPEGVRRTPTLRGGLSGSEPFHWGGELRDMNALVGEVMIRRMGMFTQSKPEVIALTRWLDAQPALPSRDGLDPEAVARGKALFESRRTNCAGCHPGTQGTNNLTVDVGTGQPLQVPRLVEVGTRTPLFHDGRIATLADRFADAAGGDRHGLVSDLDAAERADLVTYLRSR